MGTPRHSDRVQYLQGDCSFAVFRAGQMVYKSDPLQHYFDCPFQVNRVRCYNSSKSCCFQNRKTTIWGWGHFS